MTVTTTIARSGPYTGTGADTFDYEFKILTETDLVVTHTDANDVETTLTYPTDYAVTGAGADSGGTFILTTPLLVDEKATATRGIALTQEADLDTQGDFFPQTHESAWDKLTLIVQQLYERIQRSPFIAISSGIDVSTLTQATYVQDAPVDTTNFDAVLGEDDDTVQKCLDKIDNTVPRALIPALTGHRGISSLEADVQVSQLPAGGAWTTVCDGAASGTTRLVQTLNIYHTGGAGGIVDLSYYVAGIGDFIFWTGTLAGGASLHITNPLVIMALQMRGRIGAGNTADVTTHFGIDPEEGRLTDVTYGLEVTNVDGVGWHTIVSEPNAGTQRVVLTITLRNFAAASPTTTLALTKTATSTRYPFKDYTVGILGAAIHGNTLYLQEGWRLEAQQSVDPTVFLVGTHYATLPLYA